MATRSDNAATAPRRPFREALEAAVSALVVALLLKLFAVEAYRIPTGSMMPTLFGHEAGDGATVKDTVLVDRLVYLVGDPARFDVAVFRFPLDRSRAFVKRVWGLPGDTLRIAHGDVQRLDTDGAWRAMRRPEGVMREMWLPIDVEGALGLTHARFDGSGDLRTGAPIALTPPVGELAAVEFPRGAATDPANARIVDRYRDGLPPRLAARVAESGGRHAVGDLRLEFELRIPDSPAAARTVVLELAERDADGWRIHRVTSSHATGAVEVALAEGSAAATRGRATQIAPFSPGHTYEVALQNLDDVVRLEVDGVRSEGEVPPCEVHGSYVRVLADGAALVRGLCLARDVHYLIGRASQDTWTVPEACYFVLGDNTQRSVDSREWRLARYRFEAGPRAGETVAGQSAPGLNPLTSRNEGTEPVWYLRDEWGERQRLPAESIGMLPPIDAPFVPRDHFVGRAALTVWPLGPGLARPLPRWVR